MLGGDVLVIVHTYDLCYATLVMLKAEVLEIWSGASTVSCLMIITNICHTNEFHLENWSNCCYTLLLLNSGSTLF